MWRSLARDESGIAMGLAIMLVVVVGVMGAGLIAFVQRDLESVVTVNHGQRAFEAADAGVQAAKSQLNEDSCPESYGGESDDCEPAEDSEDWHEDDGVNEDNGMNIEGLSQSEARESSTRVLIEANSDDSFTVTSTGEYGDAKRRIEAVFENSPGISIPPAYFARGDVTLSGTPELSGISMFSRGDVEFNGGSLDDDSEDEYFGRWAEFDGEGSYPNEFNSTARPSQQVGIGAVGKIDVDGAELGTRSFDESTDPCFIADSSENCEENDPEEITFPFDTNNDSYDLDALRERALELERQDSGFNYYRTTASDIADWPDESDYDTVVFYDLEGKNHEGEEIKYTEGVNGNDCDNDDIPFKGVIVINGGSLRMSGNPDFNGGIIVRDGSSGGDYEAEDDETGGDYEGSGTPCIKGYINAGGDMTMSGALDAGSVPALNELSGLSSVEMVSWRELYE